MSYNKMMVGDTFFIWQRSEHHEDFRAFYKAAFRESKKGIRDTADMCDDLPLFEYMIRSYVWDGIDLDRYLSGAFDGGVYGSVKDRAALDNKVSRMKKHMLGGEKMVPITDDRYKMLYHYWMHHKNGYEVAYLTEKLKVVTEARDRSRKLVKFLKEKLHVSKVKS